jgi:hypothetical protein
MGEKAVSDKTLTGHVTPPPSSRQIRRWSFTIDFQLNDGSGLGDANNTVTINNFVFGSGNASGSANLVRRRLGRSLERLLKWWGQPQLNRKFLTAR